MKNKFNTDVIVAQLAQMKQELPVLLANQAKRYFADTFKQQGINGNQWQEVKRRIPGTPEYKYPKTKGLSRQTTPILVRSGNLRRAVSNSIRSTTFESIKLVNPLDYASYQNEGTDTIPARPFMRDTPELRQMQKDLIDKNFNKAFKV